jgi:hypothetical protein
MIAPPDGVPDGAPDWSPDDIIAAVRAANAGAFATPDPHETIAVLRLEMNVTRRRLDELEQRLQTMEGIIRGTE